MGWGSGLCEFLSLIQRDDHPAYYHFLKFLSINVLSHDSLLKKSCHCHRRCNGRIQHWRNYIPYHASSSVRSSRLCKHSQDISSPLPPLLWDGCPYDHVRPSTIPRSRGGLYRLFERWQISITNRRERSNIPWCGSTAYLPTLPLTLAQAFSFRLSISPNLCKHRLVALDLPRVTFLSTS